MFKNIKDKKNRKNNTSSLKYQTALEENIKLKDNTIKLQNKIIALQEERDLYKSELIEKYKEDIVKLKIKSKKGK